MPFTWATAPNQVVSVSADGLAYQTPVLRADVDERFRKNVVARWEGVVREECALERGPNGQPLPIAWALAHIGQESGMSGDPAILELGKPHDPLTVMSRGDIGVGLMQLSSLVFKRGHTLQELLDGRTNIRIGCGYLASLWRRSHGDLPTVTSMWNAGANGDVPYTSDVSEFGLRESPGHIMGILRASNAYLLGPGSNVGDDGPLHALPVASSKRGPSSSGSTIMLATVLAFLFTKNNT